MLLILVFILFWDSAIYHGKFVKEGQSLDFTINGGGRVVRKAQKEEEDPMGLESPAFFAVKVEQQVQW